MKPKNLTLSRRFQWWTFAFVFLLENTVPTIKYLHIAKTIDLEKCQPNVFL